MDVLPHISNSNCNTRKSHSLISVFATKNQLRRLHSVKPASQTNRRSTKFGAAIWLHQNTVSTRPTRTDIPSNTRHARPDGA
jgi:uncharacterized protein (DUF2336 family)